MKRSQNNISAEFSVFCGNKKEDQGAEGGAAEGAEKRRNVVAQFAGSAELETQIKANLEGLGL